MSEEIKPFSLNTELVEAFHNNYPVISEQSPEFMNHLRQKSILDFEQAGLPNKKNENYKYTNIESSFFGAYKHQYSPQAITVDLNDVFRCDVPELDTHLLLINGWFIGNQDKLLELPGGTLAGSLLEAAKRYPSLVEKYYGKIQSEKADTLHSLNNAFAQDGLFVYLPKGHELEKPIQLINLIVANEQLMIHPRNLIIADEGSKGSIIICDHSVNPDTFLMNSSTEIFAAKNSKLEIYRQQNAHDHSVQITNTTILQKENSFVNSVYITLHGGTVRNNLYVDMAEPYAENHSSGLWLADKTQHIDNNTFVHHSAPECNSTQMYKGILDDASTGIFAGRILVDKNAQKTVAYQTNKNLLMTNDAKARSKPQLEIYADDVKCSHGSATGQLDENAMFYMRARGISKREACHLLMLAFASEVIDKIKIEPLRDEISRLVEKRLRGELSRCHRCKVNCC